MTLSTISTTTDASTISTTTDASTITDATEFPSLPSIPAAGTAPPRPPRRIDRTGHRSGAIVVIAMLPKNRVLVRCDCGTEAEMQTANVVHNPRPVRSCGCALRDLYAAGGGRKSHGQSRTLLYSTWSTMIARCHNPKATGFQHYGGRGITVCERWRDSFEAFLEDMGQKPSADLTLERLANDEGYSPDNVVFADRATQARNKRTSKRAVH